MPTPTISILPPAPNWGGEAPAVAEEKALSFTSALPVFCEQLNEFAAALQQIALADWSNYNDIGDRLAAINTAISGINATLGTKANASLTISAGDGLTGGGALTANRSIEIGAPSSVSSASANLASGDTHSHALRLGDNVVGAEIARYSGINYANESVRALIVWAYYHRYHGDSDRSTQIAVYTSVPDSEDVPMDRRIAYGRTGYSGDTNSYMDSGAIAFALAPGQQYRYSLNPSDGQISEWRYYL